MPRQNCGFFGVRTIEIDYQDLHVDGIKLLIGKKKTAFADGDLYEYQSAESCADLSLELSPPSNLDPGHPPNMRVL